MSAALWRVRTVDVPAEAFAHGYIFLSLGGITLSAVPGKRNGAASTAIPPPLKYVPHEAQFKGVVALFIDLLRLSPRTTVAPLVIR